jgi:anti-sigma factor RsiW
VTGDEARERFSEAYDDELSAEERAAFEALLVEDEVLRAEWDDFRALLDGTHALAEADDPELHDDVAARREFLEGRGGDEGVPDLLAGVQKKIRERSRGRYYRDRFAERGRNATPLLLAIVMALVLGMAWFGLSYVQLEAERGDEAGER